MVRDVNMLSLDSISNFAKLQYIERYWKKEIPEDYPESDSEFSLQYDTLEERTAVREMEAAIGTEEDITTEAVPENTYVSNYIGTYNVTGEPGENVLLSPVYVGDVEGVIAMHYLQPDGGEATWEAIEDAHVADDGYVYGTVESFSPIAVFVVAKDIEVKENYVRNQTLYVANGNPVRIFVEDDKTYIQNKNSGTKIEIVGVNNATVIGGTIDATPVKRTEVVVEPGVKIRGIFCGSHNANQEKGTTVESANVVVNGATLVGVTGSSGNVHTAEVNITVTDSKITSHIGSGESICYMADGTNPDANKGFTPETLNGAAPYATNKVNINLKNTFVYLLYGGANTGMTFTNDVNMNIDGGEFNWCIFGASNGRTEKVSGTVANAKGNIFQTTNRGIVGNVSATIKESQFDMVFVAGDNTDATVTGVVNHVDLDLGSGTYKLIPGTNGGVEMTYDVAQEIVGKVKYSRSATMTYANNTKDVLGSKLVMK